MKKNIGYIIVNIICAVLFVAIITFAYNAEKMLYDTIYKSTDFRTVVVTPRYSNGGYNTSKDIEDILKLDNVKDAYIGTYNYIIGESSLKNGYTDGMLTLKRFNNDINVVKGSGISNTDTGVAVCPTIIFPDSNQMNASRKHSRNGYKLLDSDFTVKYETSKGEVTKTYKMVGLYLTSDIFTDNGTCFISEKDIKEISDAQNIVMSSNELVVVSSTSGINVIIDSKNNIDKVKNNLKEIGFDYADDYAELEMDFVNILHLAPISLFIIVLFVFYINTERFIYKIKKSKPKFLSRVKKSQLIKGNIITFSLGTIIFLFTYIFLMTKVPIIDTIDMVCNIDLIIPIIISCVLFIGIPLLMKK